MGKNNSGPTQMEKGMAESEALREDRARNYAVKRANGFRCAAPGCSHDEGVFVVKVDGELTTRCKPHLDGLTPLPGQRRQEEPA